MNQSVEIRIISLKNQEVRRNSMRNIFSLSNYSWGFFDAISGENVDPYLIHYERGKRMKYPGHDMTRNEIACFISHREVWKQCVKSKKDFLVLEDDAYIIRNGFDVSFLGKLIDAIRNSIGEGALVRLGHGAQQKNYKRMDCLINDFQLVRYRRDPLCALAYFISPAVAEKLLNASEKFYLPVDDFMWNYNESHITVFDLEPVFFSAAVEGNPSTIGDRKKMKIKFLAKIKREFNRFLYVRKLRKIEWKIFKNK